VAWFFAPTALKLHCGQVVRSILVIFTLAAGCGVSHAANQPDPQQLVRQSILNGERAWRISTEYACIKRVASRQFDSLGEVRNKETDVYAVIPLGLGAFFNEHLEHDGEPITAQARERAERELENLRGEPASVKQRRFEKELAERSYMKEVPDAFYFRITGTEQLPTGPAWVVEATPRAGFEPKSRYAHVFPRMRGTLWIDQKEVQWVKADTVATDNITFGLFIARLAKGSHIYLEQMKLPDGNWVPKSLEAKAEARTFLFFQHNFEEDITYNDYRKPAALSAAAR
jgi:hypothetical protein